MRAENSFFISEPFLFAPGLDSPDDWILWANGEKEILYEKKSPPLTYTEPLFRRRLSQLSKMTIEVVHSLVEKLKPDADTKFVFVSFRGEIERELKLNKSIIEDQMILPASFSLSVFNTPIALATIACNIKSGYNTIFPSNENFKNALLCSAAPVLAGMQKKIIFVYADEIIPPEYEKIAPSDRPPVAFAFEISQNEIPRTKSAEYLKDGISENVYDFIRFHIKKCYN